MVYFLSCTLSFPCVFIGQLSDFLSSDCLSVFPFPLGVFFFAQLLRLDRLVGLVVKASASRAQDLRFESRLRQDFSWVESYQWLKKWHSSGCTLPSAWRYIISVGTGWPGVSILWLGEMESLICNFCLSVAARKIIWADPSLRYTRMLLGR